MCDSTSSTFKLRFGVNHEPKRMKVREDWLRYIGSDMKQTMSAKQGRLGLRINKHKLSHINEFESVA